MMMRKLGLIAAAWLIAPSVWADDAPPPTAVYDRERGELSPGTGAPKRELMVNVIKSGSPTRLYATLEYGERVECYECVPLLADKLLSSDNSQVREISAWWLRRRSFGFGPVMVKMRKVAAQSPDPVQRARALQALGEFLDPHAQPTLSDAATKDTDVSVRVAAVRALGRLNALSGRAALSAAFTDTDAQVRQAALDQVLKVNFFDDRVALLGTLADDDANVRRTAAQLVGQLRVADAVEPLLGLLITDSSAQVRQAAAIALGRIGGSDAAAALADAKKVEHDDQVLDAIQIAARMK
jgi:HEAT repeat protein